MTEMYWITRFDGISGFLFTITVCSIIIAPVLVLIAYFNKCDSECYGENSKYYKRYINTYKKCVYWAKGFGIALVLSTFINIFIPTTNEALLIYGVGGTIDYIKSNNTAKQLPDKCVKALDKWVENLNEDNKQKENDNESK